MPPLPEVTSEAFQRPNGAWSYRIRVDGAERLTSGPFQSQQDAAGCGQHVASDPVVLLDFLSRR